MKDYYARYIEKKTNYTSKSEVTEVTEGYSKPEKHTFGTFGTEHTDVNVENFCLEAFLSENAKLFEQFNFEVAEREAIMISDGNLSESDAKALAYETTAKIWTELFKDQE